MVKKNRFSKVTPLKPSAVTGLLLLTAFGLQSTAPVVAQSVDDCVAANTTNAISLCKSLLNNGSRNRGIYLKLGKVYWGSGEYKEALAIIDQGLAIYPQDRNLLELKNTLLTADEEERRNKEAAQKNLDRVKQGQLKLSCRSKDTRDALTACRDYLIMSGSSDPVIEERISQLEILVGTKRSEPAPESIPGPNNEETVVATNNIESQTTAEEKARKAEAERRARELQERAEQDKVRRLELVTRTQTLLNEMGLNVGRADGVPGQKTQFALSNFYEQMGLNHTPFIDERTIQHLENANRNHNEAQKLYIASQRSLDNENVETALQELNSAQSLSPFLVVEAGYERRLNQKINELATQRAEAEQMAEAEVIETPATEEVESKKPIITASAPASSTEQQDALLANIHNLNRLISVEQQSIDQTLSSVRRNAYLFFR